MSLVTTAAFISTVNSDHTIQLPEEVPIGAKVAIFLMPGGEPNPDQIVRRARFEKVIAAVRAAIADGFTPPIISDAELKARIQRARQAAKGKPAQV
jgi:hypothetical protein